MLAIQGAFIEHEKILNNLGADCVEIRNWNDLAMELDGMVLPGGESTVMGKLLNDLGLFENIKSKILGGLPVLATCAGAILLAEEIEGKPTSYFGTIPMKIKRNAYGRQLSSFVTKQEVLGIGTYSMRFIRAPYIMSVSPNVTVMGIVNDKIVAVEYGNQLALTFHPELTEDYRIHKYFLNKASCNKQ